MKLSAIYYVLVLSKQTMNSKNLEILKKLTLIIFRRGTSFVNTMVYRAIITLRLRKFPSLTTSLYKVITIFIEM